MLERYQRTDPIVPAKSKAINGTAFMCGVIAAMEGGGSGWSVMERGVQEYDVNFASVFPEGIQAFIEDKHKRREPTAVLDFMGFGKVFGDIARFTGYPAVHGVSVSLNHWVPTPLNEVSPKDTTVHVTGNVLYDSTWSHLDDAMRALGERRFGLIVWAALGGSSSSYITPSVEVFQELLNRLWARLSVQNGVLLVEVPWHAARDDRYKWWKEDLRERNRDMPTERELFAWGSYDVMRLTKTPHMKELPPIIPQEIRHQPQALD